VSFQDRDHLKQKEYIVEYVILGAIGLLILYILSRIFFTRVTVMEYQRGVRYRKGLFKDVLPAGPHWISPYQTKVEMVDIRPRIVTVPGQEILSADGISLKISISASYEITAPELALNQVGNFGEAIYAELQLAARQIIGDSTIDDLLEKRNEISNKLMEIAGPKAEVFGLRIISAGLKDIMFPGQLKQVFAGVVKARKEGQALIEKARGETAALRNLANAARMVDTNPSMMQLRMVQAISESPGSTLILGMPPHGMPLPVKSHRANGASEKSSAVDKNNE
jgi:regulator of protease activity HflC (stomatin/prohibitin superfamily)